MISKEVLFASIDALRAKLHKPVPRSLQYKESTPNAPYSLGSDKLDLAKEAFFKHVFSYVRQENGFHYWSRRGGETHNTEVSLGESEDNVWICASTLETELPMEATLITDVWNDTGILPPMPETGLPIDDKVHAVRERKLMASDEGKKTPELTAAIQGHPKAINTELTRFVDTGEIVKVRRGVYRLPEL